MGRYYRKYKNTKECIGHCEAKHHKPWFDDECSKLVVQRKQAKLEWLQDPRVVNEDNLNDVRWDTTRYLKNKKRECLKEKMNELVRFQVLTAASMMMETVRTSEMSVDNHFTRQYIPEDNSEHH
jgi:hypothetical protein